MQGRQKALAEIHQMGPEPLSLAEQASLARQLARDVVAVFEFDRRQVNRLSLQIGRAMFQYVGLKAAREQWKPTKQQREILVRLQRQILEVRETIAGLNPGYRRAIGNLVGFPDDQKPVSLADFGQQLELVAASTSMVAKFLYPPAGRRRDHGLEAAIRRLLPIYEKLTGEPAGITWHKDPPRPPEARTRSMAALVHTLRRFPSPPTKTAISHKVEWVQQNPESEMYDVEVEILRHYIEADAPS